MDISQWTSLLSGSTGHSSLQKTYDDCYLLCSTAVYFENQVSELRAFLFRMAVTAAGLSTVSPLPLLWYLMAASTAVRYGLIAR